MHICKTLQSGTMVIIRHRSDMNQIFFFVLKQQTINLHTAVCWIVENYDLETFQVLKVFRVVGLGLTTSLKLACSVFALETGKKVLLVHHSLKKWCINSVLFSSAHFFVFFSNNFCFYWFIRNCKTITLAIIFHKCKVKTVVHEKLCYKSSFWSRYSIL